jgi:hypothetical protein
LHSERVDQEVARDVRRDVDGDGHPRPARRSSDRGAQHCSQLRGGPGEPQAARSNIKEVRRHGTHDRDTAREASDGGCNGGGVEPARTEARVGSAHRPQWSEQLRARGGARDEVAEGLALK